MELPIVEGAFTLTPALNQKRVAFLRQFKRTRRMTWNPEKLGKPDYWANRAGLGLGKEGSYYVSAKGLLGQDYHNPALVDFNSPPGEQPSLWCLWNVSKSGTDLFWEADEYNGNCLEWLQYLVTHFFTPWNIEPRGQIVMTLQGNRQEITIEKGVLRSKPLVATHDETVDNAISLLVKLGYSVTYDGTPKS